MAHIFETLPLGTLTIVLVIKTYYLIFAVMTVVGGIMGYKKAKSMASLVAGGVSGALLLCASFLTAGHHPNVAYIIGLSVSVLLAGKFVPDFLHKKAVVPGGLMAVLSLASIVLTLLAWYGK